MQHVNVHCWRGVQHVALLGLHGAQRVFRVEELGGTHECRERHGAGKHNARIGERVVERQRAADARRRVRVVESQPKVFQEFKSFV